MSSLVALLLERGGLDGPVLVGSGRITADQPEVAAAAGQKFYLFSPWNGGYTLLNDVDTGVPVLSLAVGLPVFNLDNVILGTADRLLVYGGSQGTVSFLGETEPEAGALFVNLALGDLDGDGREEVVAAAEGNESLYIYRLGDETGAGLRLELLAVRVLPGPAQKTVVLKRGGGQLPLIVVAYRQGNVSGLLTLSYTEMGFAEGPAVDALPAGVTALTAGDFTPGEGEEPAWGGNDGRARIMEVNDVLDTALVTDNLGSAVTALAAAGPAGEQAGVLLAGTPEGFLFGYRLPVTGASPDWAARIGRPVYSLAGAGAGRLALGTADGYVQVWLVSAVPLVRYVVREGDTLWSIARTFHTTVEAITAVNNIPAADIIFPGQELFIPRTGGLG
jgi:hypothetical protein